ncbi:MAG: hypothetical protein WBM50_13665 [Acidimicrobiales bacterium]
MDQHTTESPDTMHKLSDTTVDPYHGETITVRFTPHVEPSGDPHTDAENLERADREAVTFTLRTRVLPGTAFEALQREHPPMVRGDDVNPDTFYPALICASVTGWTVEQAGVILEKEDRAPTAGEAAEMWEWPEFARREVRGPLVAQNVNGPALGKARLRRNVIAAMGRTDTASSAR